MSVRFTSEMERPSVCRVIEKYSNATSTLLTTANFNYTVQHSMMGIVGSSLTYITKCRLQSVDGCTEQRADMIQMKGSKKHVCLWSRQRVRGAVLASDCTDMQ